MIFCLSVIYGSARLFALSYLILSRGIVSHMLLIVTYIKCTVIHNAHLQVPLLERNNVTNRYKNIYLYYNYIFLPLQYHKCHT